MGETMKEVQKIMTDKQAKTLIEAIKIIIEKSETKEEVLEALNRLTEKK